MRISESPTAISNPEQGPEKGTFTPLSLYLRFESHGVKPESYDSFRTETVERMRSVFRKGEINTLFIEDGAGSNIGRRASKYFPQYGSWVRSFAVYKTAHGRIIPAEDELNEMITWAKEGDPEIAYHVALCEALDTFVTEGYETSLISEIHEIYPPNKKFRQGYDYSSPQRLKDSVIQLTGEARLRNQNIKKQLTDIEKRAAREQKRVNLYLTLGAAHGPLLETLPKHLLREIVASSENASSNKSDIQFRLVMGEKIPDEEWAQAMKLWKEWMENEEAAK